MFAQGRGANIKFAASQEMGLDAYIPDRHFRRRDPRYTAQRRYWSRRKRFALEVKISGLEFPIQQRLGDHAARTTSRAREAASSRTAGCLSRSPGFLAPIARSRYTGWKPKNFSQRW